jgi:hypothetical protein
LTERTIFIVSPMFFSTFTSFCALSKPALKRQSIWDRLFTGSLCSITFSLVSLSYHRVHRIALSRRALAIWACRL